MSRKKPAPDLNDVEAIVDRLDRLHVVPSDTAHDAARKMMELNNIGIEILRRIVTERKP